MGRTAALSNSNELERLLLRMSRKDEAAFEALHAATKRKLFSTVLLVVKRRHLAEEILQEAYVRIWLNAAMYRSTLGSPMMWMITIARNLAIDVARKPTLEVYSDHAVMLNFPAEIPTALENIETRESESETIKLQRQHLLRLAGPGALKASTGYCSLYPWRKPAPAFRTVWRSGQHHKDMDQACVAGSTGSNR